ncbi:MAG: hypothetical protein WCI09_08390 [Planctomycetota bacterium]
MTTNTLPRAALEHPDIREPRSSIKRLAVLVGASLLVVADVDGHRAAPYTRTSMELDSETV